MTDRTTKAILLAIALGIWMNFFAVSKLADQFSLFPGWLTHGAPVKVNQ
jgi:hypothetical protein